jgi:hypothetical protein
MKKCEFTLDSDQKNVLKGSGTRFISGLKPLTGQEMQMNYRGIRQCGVLNESGVVIR